MLGDVAFVISAGLAAVLLVGAVVLGSGVFFHLDSLWRDRITAWTIPILALGTVVSTLFSGRDLSRLILDFDFTARGMDPIGGHALRFLTLLVVGLALAQVIGSRFALHGRSTDTHGRSLLVAFTTYFVSNSVLNAALGTRPSFDNALLYPMAIIAALYCTRSVSVAALVTSAKASLLAMLALSLVLIAVAPDLAVQSAYKGWVPGLEGRLWGVGSNPNSIGPVAVTYLALAFAQRWNRTWLNWIGSLVALGVLLLAQSKTSWLGAAVVAAVIVWYAARTSEGKLRPAMVVALLLTLAAIVVAALVVDPSGGLADIVGGEVGTDLRTLTGRVAIWDVAIDAWKQSPLFGYGVTIWDERFRQQIAMPFAFSAHNQFLQSLSAAGIVGVVGLSLYLATLFVYCLKRAVVSRGVTMALFAFLVLRCMTETPLDITGIFSGEFMSHLILLQLLMAQWVVLPSREPEPERLRKPAVDVQGRRLRVARVDSPISRQPARR